MQRKELTVLVMKARDESTTKNNRFSHLLTRAITTFSVVATDEDGRHYRLQAFRERKAWTVAGILFDRSTFCT